MTTQDRGIDYSLGIDNTNKNPKTGIRYGIIPANNVEYWYDDSEPVQDCDNDSEANCNDCELYSEHGECLDDRPQAYKVVTKEVTAIQEPEGTDIWVFESKYHTYAQYCSPCAPGACYLLNPLEEPDQRNKCYCFGPDWFADCNPCPYPIYEVETNKLIYQPKEKENDKPKHD